MKGKKPMTSLIIIGLWMVLVVWAAFGITKIFLSNNGWLIFPMFVTIFFSLLIVAAWVESKLVSKEKRWFT